MLDSLVGSWDAYHSLGKNGYIYRYDIGIIN